MSLTLWLVGFALYLSRALPVPECNSQSAALPQQPHPLLQLHHAVPVCRGQHRSYSGADHQVRPCSQLWFTYRLLCLNDGSVCDMCLRKLWVCVFILWQCKGIIFSCHWMVCPCVQGSVGEADSEQATPMGTPHHLHRADQESCLQVLEPWFCALCPRDWKVGSAQLVHTNRN